MPWFKVDDGLHSHPKWIAASAGARALWVSAGSWCAAQLTDGFVPAHVLATFNSRRRSATELVELGLWRTVEGGWVFHQWDEYQPSSESVLAERAAARDRQRRAREKAKGSGEVTAKSQRESRRDIGRESRRESQASNGVSHGPPDPTRPDLPVTGGTTTQQATPDTAPPRRCKKHSELPTDAEVPPCGACADARRAHDAATPRTEYIPPTPAAVQPPPIDQVRLDPIPIETNGNGIANAKAALRHRPPLDPNEPPF